MNEIADFIFLLHQKGVKLWIENNNISYQADQGALTPNEIKNIVDFKVEIIEFIQQSQSCISLERKLTPRKSAGLVPITYTQQWIWNYLKRINASKLGGRSCADVKRISGRLSRPALQNSVKEVIRRHESLRTKIVELDGVPMQKIHAKSRQVMEFVDLTMMDISLAESEAKRIASKAIYEPIDDSVFAAILVKIRECDHIFVVAMNHMISDQVSTSILVCDIWTSYSQSVLGEPVSLPEISIQYGDYAVWQKETSQDWLEAHNSYWSQRLLNAPCVRFPVDKQAPSSQPPSFDEVPIRLSPSLTSGLREVCCAENTTIALGALTAFLVSILRWQDKDDYVIKIFVSGRKHPGLENAIGFFASILPLRIQLKPSDTYLDFLKRVTQEYCIAYEHYDAGRLSLEEPLPDYMRGAIFNWLQWTSSGDGPEYEVLRNSLYGTRNLIELKPFDYPTIFPVMELDGNDDFFDTDPSIMISETLNGISGNIWYRSDMFDTSTMATLANNFGDFVEILVNRPQTKVKNMVFKN